MATTKGVELWERQPRESPEAWEAFLLYRDWDTLLTDEERKQYGKRSVRAVARKLSKSDTLIKRWSSNWEWGKRCEAYSNFLQQEERKQLLKDRRKSNKFWINASHLMANIGLEALQKIDPSDLSVKETLELMKQARGFETSSMEDERTLLGGDDIDEDGESGPTVHVFVPDNGRMRRQPDDE